MLNGAWVGDFGEVIARLESCMVTATGFSFLLGRLIDSSTSPLSGVTFSIETINGPAINLGRLGNGKPDHVTTITLTGPRHKSAKLCLWFQDIREAGESSTVGKTVGLLRQAFDAWWIPDARSPKGDLPMWTDATKRRGQGALAYQRSRGAAFSVIFCDLDNFKRVNAELGQAGGDAVISRLATFLENVVADEAVIVHHGGDEFMIILPELATQFAIALSSRVIRESKSFDFGSETTPIKFSFGIVSSSDYPSASFEELAKIADENALKALVKNDVNVKGAMRVSAPIKEPLKWARPVDSRVLSLMLRNNLQPQAFVPAFDNVWLNALVLAGRSEFQSTHDFSKACAKILEAFETYKLMLGTIDISYLPLDPGNVTTPNFSALDLAATAARVFFEECLVDSSIASDDHLFIHRDKDKTILSVGNKNLMEIPSVSEKSLKLDLGPAWKIENQTPIVNSGSNFNTSPFILLEIGRNHLLALPRLAAAQIVIDDRPVRGGGLPDFWELSLSRLIRCLGGLPNVEKIVIVGDKSNASETVSMLQSHASWDIDYLSYKTSVPKKLVIQAQKRLDGNVSHFSKEEDAIESLLEVACSPKNIYASGPTVDDEPGILLQRTLDFPKASLGPEDGCRVRTAAEAYPLMLEILRADKGHDELIIDQDGIQIRELVDFKVVVQDPEREQIPWFFHGEKSKLENYFSNQFLASKGKFAGALRDNGFEERILNHVKWALTRTDGQPFATRRAILVVPHSPEANPELMSPLGLVSIRVLPRPSSSETILNFSFTWRTVEALIGFPYSLYGSLKYSEHLCAELQKLCPSKPVKLGYVSYMAHSLHFFVSEESKRIARGIVGESSN